MKLELDLFVDESGDFAEYKCDSPDGKCFSQIVGLLAPHGELNKKEARSILKTCFKSSHQKLSDRVVHGYTLSPGKVYDKLICTLVKEINLRGWQTVRLVNREQIYLGGCFNFSSMVGELALQIFAAKSRQYKQAEIKIHFRLSRRSSIGRETEHYRVISQAIRDYITFAAVRRGISMKYIRWRIGEIEVWATHRSRHLQICDLLSNSSYCEYRKCGEETKAILQASFGNYDLTMVMHRELEECDRFVDEGSLGLAIITLAKILHQSDKEVVLHSQVMSRLDAILDRLAGMSDPSSQLNFLVSWLEQLIEQEHLFSLGYQVAQWMETEVYRVLSLKRNFIDDLDWFHYSLYLWMLVASNYQNNLIHSQQAAAKLAKLTSAIAQRWEHLNLVVSGAIADAVYRINCRQYDKVAERMNQIADRFGADNISTEIDSQMSNRKNLSRLPNKALDTWLHSEICASASQPRRIDRARSLSTVNIEFTNPIDRAIQYRYRCQLEIIAQDFPRARDYLAQSLNITNSSHSAIASNIADLAECDRGFAISNWLHLGTTAYLVNCNREWNQFMTALQQSQLLQDAWCLGRQSISPVRSILRRVALIETIERDRPIALKKLQNLNSIQQGFAGRLIQCAAHAEVAALQWNGNNSLARKVLSHAENKRPGLQQLLETIAKEAQDFPKLVELTQSWLEVVTDVLENDNNVQQRLINLSMQIV